MFRGFRLMRIDEQEASIKKTELKFRPVESDDINDLFEWRNHQEVRKNSFSSKPLSWDEHEKWFKVKLKDPGTVIYMVYTEGEKVGSIRFEEKGDAIKVSVMLNPDFFGKGLGAEIIKSGTEKFIREKKCKKPVIAEIKKDNIASIKAFEKAGFLESHITFIYGN